MKPNARPRPSKGQTLAIMAVRQHGKALIVEAIEVK